MLAVQPQSPGLADRIWWGSGSRETAVWAGEQGLNLIDGAISRFGRSYTGERHWIADELAKDAAVRAADTILLTVPSQLGVDYNVAMLETIARHIAPAVGLEPEARTRARRVAQQAAVSVESRDRRPGSR
jgi:hypothetical protein